jgi:FtsP/CotA-like multicopper oxidase with cupredoxin domain/uncharacterized cupredoxin-like copper-binding protein
MDPVEQERGRFFGAVVIASVLSIVLPLTALGIVAVATDGNAAAVGAASTTVDVALSEFVIGGDLVAPPGDVKLSVTNKGTAEHNLTLKGGPATKNLKVGENSVLDLGVLAAGDYTVICTIPGHEGAGMKSTLTVSASAAAATSSHDHSATATIDYAAMDKAMTDSINKFLEPSSKTKVTGNQRLAPTISADGTKVFTLTAEIIDWETGPGTTVKAWAYNGQVPGPEIKVDVGDKVRLTLINKLPMGTDIHLHGVDVPFAMDGVAPLTQALVVTGQSFNYDFVAKRPAIGMYHAHNGGEMQVPNGLFGAFIIGETSLPKGRTIGGVTIPTDLKVAQEFPMVLNDAGVIGLTLNAKSFPATDPVQVKSGDWFVTHYYNEGLMIHPMHMHGLDQLVIAKDGFPLDQPYWADTVLVSPGERYSVLVHADKPAGTAWVWHCHILSHVESDAGAFGMFTAVVVN